jgi:hypothetical protein
MEASQKLVVTIPLQTLWHENGEPISARVGTLSSTDIAELLRAGPLRFVVADVGMPLQWIPVNQCFEFWKAKVKHNLCDAGKKIPLDAYPESYCFSASLWKNTKSAAEGVVLLEKHH